MQSQPGPHLDPIVGGIAIRDVRACTCLRLRRSARQTTQVYDAYLSSAGVTIGQFGLLAQLYGAQIRAPGLALKRLADLIGMDQTTLSRTLKPMRAAGWLAARPDPSDQRSKIVSLTAVGVAKLTEALPLWARAQATVDDKVGHETVLALSGLLDVAGHRLGDRKSQSRD